MLCGWAINITGHPGTHKLRLKVLPGFQLTIDYLSILPRSPVALFDDNGAVVERCEYDAYGKVQVLSSQFLVLSSQFLVLSSSQPGNPYTFTGRELLLLPLKSVQ